MWVDGQRHAPAALPPGKIWYPFYRGLGGPQGLYGQVRKISPPPGFDPWTVQPIASSYTNCLKILDARRVTWSKFHTKNRQVLGALVQNLVIWATWCAGFMYPWHKELWTQNCSYVHTVTFLTGSAYVYGHSSLVLTTSVGIQGSVMSL